MKELFSKKIEGIHKSLIECYRDTQNYSPSIIGAEREIFQRELLSKILPSTYRIGSGTICDAEGNETGEIDAVIELPFSLSFPISSGQHRLYLADTVGMVLEIKSNLYNKWDEAINKTIEVKRLNRYKPEEGEIILLESCKIPVFIVAYKGFGDINTIYEKLSEIQMRDRPDGILVIESGIFWSRGQGGSLYEARTNRGSILAFISCVYRYLQAYSHLTINLFDYVKIL